MKLESKHKIDTAFNFSSIADVIFLLLIFFMLTSSFVTPSGLPVNLPSSKSSNIVMQKVSVTITPDIRFYVNEQLTPVGELESSIANALSGADEGVVVLNVDKSVPVEHLVKVAGIASSLKAKVSIATKPE